MPPAWVLWGAAGGIDRVGEDYEDTVRWDSDLGGVSGLRAWFSNGGSHQPDLMEP